MPTYRFFLVAEGDHVIYEQWIDRYASMHDPGRPKWGDELMLDGERWRCLPSIGVVGAPIADTHFTCVSQPPYDPDYPRVDEHGQGQFDNAREVREWLAKKRAKGKEVHYDRPGFH